MPGDPEECRQHAVNCRTLAEQAASTEARERFLGLALQRERLAAELEGAQAFLKAVQTLQDENVD